MVTNLEIIGLYSLKHYLFQRKIFASQNIRKYYCDFLMISIKRWRREFFKVLMPFSKKNREHQGSYTVGGHKPWVARGTSESRAFLSRVHLVHRVLVPETMCGFIFTFQACTCCSYQQQAKTSKKIKWVVSL